MKDFPTSRRATLQRDLFTVELMNPCLHTPALQVSSNEMEKIQFLVPCAVVVVRVCASVNALLATVRDAKRAAGEHEANSKSHLTFGECKDSTFRRYLRQNYGFRAEPLEPSIFAGDADLGNSSGAIE